MMNARNTLGAQGGIGGFASAIGFLLALIAIALLARDAMSQEIRTAEAFDLVGNVVDHESGQALVGAFVSLTGSDWGSITDENGRFRIPDVFEGSSSLTAEQLGYETLTWEGRVEQGSAVQLRLTPQPILLEGLKVVTDRFQSRRNRSTTSVFAYDREDLATSTQRTLLDFVALRVGTARVPCWGATTGDICFRLRGRTVEPTVFVDENPILGGLDYLDRIPPQELYMVEIFALGRHIRAYTTQFMERAAKTRLQPVALLF